MNTGVEELRRGAMVKAVGLKVVVVPQSEAETLASTCPVRVRVRVRVRTTSLV